MDYTPPQEMHAQCETLHRCPVQYHENTSQQCYAPTRCPFLFQEDLAQYGGSDYANAVRVERGISIDEAMHIALEDPSIDYFFYTKGGQMVLEAPSDLLSDPLGLISYHRVPDGFGKYETKAYRIFHHGDVVFFSGNGCWLGEANGLADVYSKTMSTCGS